MFQKGFAEIFAELDSLEKDLRNSQGKGTREKVSQRLLDLRKNMDQCIQSWLSFEERVNQLQDNYGLDLPDEIPDIFFKNLGLIPTSHPGEPTGAGSQDPSETQERSDTAHELAYQPPEPGGKPAASIKNDASISTFKRGLGFYDLYMLDEAVTEFENLVNLEPDLMVGHFLLGHVYCQMKQYERAEQEFRLVLALAEDQQLKAMVYNALGNIYAREEKYEQALEEFQLAWENSREVKEASFNLAATYYNMGMYRECIDAFREAMNHFPHDWEIYFYMGKAYQYLKDYSQALSCLEEALKRNPLNSALNFELGVLYHILNRRENAISRYVKAVELNKGKAPGTN